MKKRVLFVGLEATETDVIMSNSACLAVVYENLPQVKLMAQELFVESKTHLGRFLKIDKVVYHGIFEHDFDFLTLLALWGGECLPNAMGMMDLRLRHAGLVRALRITAFGNLPRGMSLNSETYTSPEELVAKWSNWHCGENKARFQGDFLPPDEAVLYEPFIQGEAVRIMLAGEKHWQISLQGDDWLKSIHHQNATEMPADPELVADTQKLAAYFGLAVVGVDYMIDTAGNKFLLEVNHIPNVTVFPFMREAYINLATQFCNE
ncbi:MAG: hypothetical protein H7Y04_08255 [Verrucomicrobia bacterium]|nr:hypothetical protein [Cytophagales bacterium]